MQQKTTSGDPTAVQTQAPEPDEPLLSGRYRLIEQLGEGGMGLVYRGEHVLMKKTVAIKVLHRELTENAEIVARFQREAQAAATLESPYVCQATDFGQTEDGAFFLVMEYLKGQTIQEAIGDLERFPVDQALRLAKQILSALSTAHQQGIVHRDLKPENIMLVPRDDGEDRIKIMDFGIARMLAPDDEPADPETRLTRAGMVYGTPHYMSPEQVAGEDVDERTDLYAFGCVLFEMLTGVLPFDGETIARIMGQHVTQAPPTLSESYPDGDFSPDLEALIADLLEKAPEARPQTADEVLQRIETLLSPPTPVPEKPEVQTSSPATITMESISRGAMTTGEATVGSVERVVGTSLTAVDHSFRWWQGLRPDHRRVVLLATGAALFVSAVLSVVLLLIVLQSSDPQEELAVDRQNRLDDAAVTAALDDARDGDRTAIEELLEEHPEDAHLRFLVLQADIESGHDVKILDEIESIFSLDRRYAHDETLISLIIDDLYRSSTEEAAAELLAAHMTPTARAALSEIARTASQRSRRNKAYAFLEEHNQIRHFDRWEVLALELRQTSGCTNLREKIQEIERLRNPDALSTLRAVSATPRSGCGLLRRQDCIGCIRGDLATAIETLEARE